MQQFTTYQTQQRGLSVTIFGVPTTFSAGGEELGCDLKVIRDLDLLITRAVEAAVPNMQVLESATCACSRPGQPGIAASTETAALQ